MQVVCSKCKTRYTIPAEKLHDGVVKVRCKHCGHVFGVRRKKAEERPLPVEPLDITPHLAGNLPATEEPPAPEGSEPPLREESAPAPRQEPEPEPPVPEAEGAPARREAGEEEVTFGDFNLDDLALLPPRESAEPGEPPPLPEGIDLGEPQAATEEEEPLPEPEPFPELSAESSPGAPGQSGEVEEEFSFDDLSLDEYSTSPKPPPPKEEEEEPASQGATYDKFAKMRGGQAEAPDLGDLDLSDFSAGEEAEPAPAAGKKVPPPAEKEPEPLSADEFAKTLGELDLGSFEEEEEPPEPKKSPALEKVSSEEILSLADSTPAKPVKAPKVKKPRGPFPWALLAVVLFLAGSVAFLAYNIMSRPDSAFVLVNPFALSEIMERSSMQKKLAVLPDPKGGYVDRDDKKRVYAVLALVKNETISPVSAVRVRANLFGAGGPSLALREAYCGNIVGREELLGLPLAKVVSAGDLQVGAAFANVDIAPGASVACLVVFPDPPTGVEKFSVEVVNPTFEEKKSK